MIVFPKSLYEVNSAKGELRAGGTDLQERRHRGVRRVRLTCGNAPTTAATCALRTSGAR